MSYDVQLATRIRNYFSTGGSAPGPPGLPVVPVWSAAAPPGPAGAENGSRASS